MKNPPVFLLFPPGWIYTTGGSNLALPLLKGYLEASGIETYLFDLNIGLSDYFKIKISNCKIESACEIPSLENLNKPYYLSQDKMSAIAKPYGATWDIQLGFNYDGCSFSSSDEIRKFSEFNSPFDSYYDEELINQVEKLNPSIIGISVCSAAQLLTTFQIVRILKRTGYSGKIILGGNIITRLEKSFLKDWVFELIDGIVVFQGEIALSSLYFALQIGKELDYIPNLIWKKKGEIKKNKIEYLPQKDFGRPSYVNLSFKSYWGINYIPVLGSRGCYYGKCTFCSIPFAYGNNGFLGHDNPLSVYDDMVNGFDLSGINNYKFMEEALHPAILRKLSDKIISENFDCEFEGYARLDSFWQDEKFLQNISKAGLRKVYLGLELITSDKRGLLNKSDSNKALEMLKKFSDAGIKTHIFTLFGYPGTGIEEAVNTIEFVLQNKNLIDTLDIFPFYYAKHTKVPFIDIINNKAEDWALEHKYMPAIEEVLTMAQTSELCYQLEDIIWNEIPKWLHPIYRLYSPWSTKESNNNTVIKEQFTYV